MLLGKYLEQPAHFPHARGFSGITVPAHAENPALPPRKGILPTTTCAASSQ